MSKDLKDLSLDELWQLFPIIIKPYNKHYPDWYTEEANSLNALLKDYKVLRMNHIGSTAIPKLASKPTIDILCELETHQNIDEVAQLLAQSKWIIMHEDTENHAYVLNKGYTIKGYAEKVFHLHLRFFDDHHELYFKDYLLEHPDIVREYEKLKKDLAIQYKHHREHYTDAKTEFIQKYTKRARTLYKDRYKSI